MSDDDARWVEGLAGRDDALPEARVLRAGILARPVGPVETVPARDASREDALVDRARREGLLPKGSRFWDSRRVVATLAVAASLALAAVIFTRAPHEPGVVRGVEAGIVRMEAANPEALQRTLLRELAAAGVQATGYERLGRYGVDADLPAELTPELRATLARHGIPAPADGALTIEIAARTP